jgi:5-methylthioadenosine/S-adenosylhomocysteine deaminase
MLEGKIVKDKMNKADILLTNAIVLTMDEAFRVFEPGTVAIMGDSIIKAGAQSEMENEFSAAQIIDCQGKVLMPGLVNAHTHVPMTLLRGLADDLRLDVWLLGYMMPVEREFVSPDFVRLGTKLACAEMIRSGVTCFADMYYFEEEIAKTVAEVGMRAVCGQSILKFPTPDAQFYEDSLAAAQDFIKRWKGHPLVVPAVSPHAPYTCTPEILRASAELAKEFDVPLHTHLAETSFEVENLRSEVGMPVIPYVRKYGLFDAKVIAAHCVWVDEGEMRTLQHVNAGVAHNPSSNMKLASGVAPIKRMLELGLNVGIGTDGPASNNDLDMFEEIRLATFLAKNSSGDPTVLPARTALSMATRLGAKALHLGDITGTLEPGKRADLILVDISSPHNNPRFKHEANGVYAQLVYAGKSTDVTDVMINGRWVMQKRELCSLKENELLVHSQEYARRIDMFIMAREQSILSKLIAIGGAMEEESFEIQVKVKIRDTSVALQALQQPQIEIIRKRHYREYDTYFAFDDPKQGWLRYREDNFVDEGGTVTHVRTRLTLIGTTREGNFPQEVLLSRSRYLAPATQTLRFYREYFRPTSEFEIEKDRLRFLVRYKETEFYINLDTVTKPDLGKFLEVKSRTWSKRDAEQKSDLASELIQFLGATIEDTLSEEYIEIIQTTNHNEEK